MSVITLQEQEHGTELDLAPTRHLSVMEGSFMRRFLTRVHYSFMIHSWLLIHTFILV